MSPTYFFLFLFGGFLHAQVFVSGLVSAADTGEPLPYVNIGIPNEGIGTVSNEAGYYQLELPEHLQQKTMRFSMVGFSEKEVFISPSDDKHALIYDITLDPETTELNEVVVTNSSWEKVRVGNKTDSKRIVTGFTSNQLGNEIAQFIRVKKNRPTKLEAFWVTLAENKIENAVLRLNIYSEKEGFPDANLLKTPIYIELPNDYQTLTLDLKPYAIYVEDDFFVSLEWIEDYGIENLWFSAGLFGKSLYARNASQGEWVRKKALSIGMGVELLQKHR